MNKHDRVRAGMWGLLVADAMGVPHEFLSAREIPEKLEMVMPAEYEKTYTAVPYGTWSDDGALALSNADAFSRSRSWRGCGGQVTKDLIYNMVAWGHRGRFAVDGHVFDIGTATASSLKALACGQRPVAADPHTENGNGALMRILPLALWHNDSDALLISDAKEVSGLTHPQPISMAACAAYCLVVRYIMQGDAGATAFAKALEQLPEIGNDLPHRPTGTGYVLDSLSFARHAVSNLSYEQAVLDAIRLGGDTDTTACIAGGLVAVRDGAGAIPAQWLKDLRGKKEAGEIIEAFVEACGSVVP